MPQQVVSFRIQSHNTALHTLSFWIQSTALQMVSFRNQSPIMPRRVVSFRIQSRSRAPFHTMAIRAHPRLSPLIPFHSVAVGRILAALVSLQTQQHTVYLTVASGQSHAYLTHTVAPPLQDCTLMLICSWRGLGHWLVAVATCSLLWTHPCLEEE